MGAIRLVERSGWQHFGPVLWSVQPQSQPRVNVVEELICSHCRSGNEHFKRVQEIDIQ